MPLKIVPEPSRARALQWTDTLEGAGKLESRGMESVAAALAGRDCRRIKVAKGPGIRLETAGSEAPWLFRWPFNLCGEWTD